MGEWMRILVINSCGKGKAGSFEEQATCSDLITDRDRARYVSQQASRALPARDLYTGQQATKIARAVDILRNLGHTVDYRIISAGFGLVEEMTPLPPYECTFSGMKKGDLKEMADRLGIAEDIRLIRQGYDLAYLSLGSDYLRTFDINDLVRKAETIVHFDRSTKYTSGSYFQVNDSEIIGKDSDVAEFVEAIGNLVQSKGSILLNYALYIHKYGHMSFETWWNKAIASMNSFDVETIASTSSSSDILISQLMVSDVKQGQPVTGYDLMDIKDETEKEAKKLVKPLDDKDIREIHKAHVRLNPRDSQREDREKWVEKYSDREAEITKWADWFATKIDDLQSLSGDTKTNVKAALAAEVRAKQEALGFDEYLINPVRIALMSTFTKYIANPELLKKSPKYKPRKEKTTKTKASQVLAEDSFAITANEKEDALIGKITYSGNYPMQNVIVKLQKKDGSKLMIQDAKGQDFTVASGDIHIGYIRAPMSNASTVIDFKIVIDGFYDFSNGYTMEVTADDTINRQEVTKSYNF
ncbi:MAG: hypothetical protein ACXAE3_12135 [Candidatus Kariarchaeaceae archaeon]|jgi:hypothetical protein